MTEPDQASTAPPAESSAPEKLEVAPPATESPAPPQPAARAAKAPADTPRGIVEWFWRGRSLQQARSFRSDLSPAEQQALARALAARELADRAYDPIDALRTGPSLGLSISLNREAAYWALLAQDERYAGADLAALFASIPESVLSFAAGGSEGLAEVRRALVQRTFVETAALAKEQLPREALVARAFVHALLRRKLEPEAQIGRLLLQRGARVLGAVLFLLALVLGGWSGIERLRLKPDLAAGKPWRASSSQYTCRPEQHRCDAINTDVFFHTNEEKAPWLELDLGQEVAFDRVEVVNRRDCCPDRAIPLVIEVSSDRKNFREVSRRVDTFSTWKAQFAPQKARYVRLRVPRRTILHLEKVAVRNGQ